MKRGRSKGESARWRARLTDADREAIDRHEETTRSNALLVALGTVVAYLIVVTTSASDAAVLRAEEGLILPILNLSVSFVGFYSFAPVLLIGLQVLALRPGFHQTGTADGASRMRTTPLHEVERGLLDIMIRYSAPVTMIVVFWRICDLQNVKLTAYHALCVGASIAILEWARAVSVKKAPAKTGASPPLHSVFAVWAVAKKARFLGPRRILPKVLWVSTIAVFSLKLLVFCDVVVRDWESSWVRRLVFVEGRFITESGSVEDPLGLIPNLVIRPEEELFDLDPEKLSLISSLHGHEDWNDWFLERGRSIDLSDRSLRLAFLQFQTLPRLWAPRSRLDGANLSFALLTGAVLRESQLRDVDWSLANLSGAYMNASDIRGANFSNTRASGANFDGSNLSSSDLVQSRFDAAWLGGADLSQSLIVGSDFNGAYFNETNISDSYIVVQPTVVVSIPEGDRHFAGSSEEDEDFAGSRLIANDVAASKAWVRNFCGEAIYAGDEEAARSVLKAFAVVRHPVFDLLSSELRANEGCDRLLKALGEDAHRLLPRRTGKANASGAEVPNSRMTETEGLQS
jgi:hypothetical protein